MKARVQTETLPRGSGGQCPKKGKGELKGQRELGISVQTTLTPLSRSLKSDDVGLEWGEDENTRGQRRTC